MARTTMTQVTIGFQEDNSECIWQIPNWNSVVKSKEEILKQNFIMETDQSSYSQSKWEIGLMTHRENEKYCLFYWKLLESRQPVDELVATMIIKHDNVYQLCKKSSKFKAGQLVNTEGLCVMPISNSGKNTLPFVKQDGSANLRFFLRVMIPYTLRSSRVKGYSTSAKLCKLFAATSLNGSSPKIHSAPDIKIVTCDAKVFPAHKFIFKDQCPVLGFKFRSQLAENATAVVNVNDISGKTMEVILYFFYTGQLLPTWCDKDVIVELIWAAGNYHMTDILQKLDALLGDINVKDTLGIDLQLLILAHKYSLKEAESKLLKRVMRRTDAIKSVPDLLTFILGKQ